MRRTEQAGTHLNPYAAPPPVRSARKLRYWWVKYAYLAAALTPTLVAPFALVANTLAAALLGFATMMSPFVAIAAYLSWLWNVWSSLPEKARAGTLPSAAVGLHFVPMFNVYWMFALNVRLSRALDALLRSRRSRARAPNVLAWLIPTLSTSTMAIAVAAPFWMRGAGNGPVAGTLVMAGCFLNVVPFFVFAWMFRVDGCLAEIQLRSSTSDDEEEVDSDARPSDGRSVPATLDAPPGEWHRESVNRFSSYPPTSCKKCDRTDANWIVSRLGCSHCFDPFATAAQLKALEQVAETADEVAEGRSSIEALRKAVARWRSGG